LDLGDVLNQLLKSVETTTLQSLPFLEIESFVPKTEEKEDTITDADIFAMLQSASDPFASFKKEEAQELDYVNLKEGLQILNQVDNGSNKFVNEALRKKQQHTLKVIEEEKMLHQLHIQQIQNDVLPLAEEKQPQSEDSDDEIQVIMAA